MGEADALAAKAPGQGNQTAEGGVSGITFDSGGLIALEKNDRRVYGIIDTILAEGGRIVVPATALAQVIRNPATQVRLWRMIQADKTEVVPLDAAHAQAVGVLLAKTMTSDIADAHVVICARRAGHAVITSDPFDLRRLDPRLRTITV